MLVNRELVRFLQRHFGRRKFSIVGLDNPGWYIEAKGFEAHKSKPNVEYDLFDDDWIFFKDVNGDFKSACSPLNLGLSLRLFAERVKEENEAIAAVSRCEVFELIQEWYLGKCNQIWEHDNGLFLEMTSDGWRLEVSGESGKNELNLVCGDVKNGSNLNITATSENFKAECGKNGLCEAFRQLLQWLYGENVEWESVVKVGDVVTVKDEAHKRLGLPKGAVGVVSEKFYDIIKNEYGEEAGWDLSFDVKFTSGDVFQICPVRPKDVNVLDAWEVCDLGVL